MHGGEQLDSDVDSAIDDDDNIIPYHQYQLNNKVESVPTDVSFVLPGGISVITILDNLRSQLAGHIKVNEEQSFANDSLKAELERYKTHVQNLEQSKVKKDLEQLVFERNKRNADLEEQLVSLKQQLLQHVESNKFLKTECEKLKIDKNSLEESYLEELLDLKKASKDDFIIQQCSKSSGEGYGVALEVHDGLHLKGPNKESNVNLMIPGEPSSSLNSSRLEYKIEDISSDDESDGADDKEKAEAKKPKEEKAEEEQHMDDVGGNEKVRDIQAKVHEPKPQIEKPEATILSSSHTLSSAKYGNQFINDDPDVSLTDVLKETVKAKVQ
uniref:Uncharacterized protein n=1 Tax=Tanacetum cinerariifolium TaxID=118510 RepID=A0A6L2P1K4_TANCI|nr:hypothetical protein [Tanacetum cinerariifolium]